MLSLEKGVHISMKKLFQKDVFRYYNDNNNPNYDDLEKSNKKYNTKKKIICLNDLAKIAYSHDKNSKNKLQENTINTEGDDEPNYFFDQIKNSIDLYAIDNENTRPII